MISIREAMIQDAKHIAEISTNALGYPCHSSLVSKRIMHLDANKQKVFVAVDGAVVVGFVHAELYQLLYQEDMINVLGLAVATNFQGNGAGTALMQAVERWAMELNCTTVRLNSAANRTEAHRFYEKIGYSFKKSQKRFVKNL